jgi:hypothetical protein
MNNELEIWFENLINEKRNDKILFIDNLKEEDIYIIQAYYVDNSDLNHSIKINFLDDTGYGKAFPIKANSLVYVKSGNNFAETNIFEKDIIYVSSNIFIHNFEKFINSFRSMSFPNYTFKIKDLIYNIEYSVIEKVSIKEIIENKDELLDKIRIRKQLLKNILGKDFHFNKIETVELNYQNNELIGYINILKNKNILIASFAHYLYKIFMLDFNSSTTKVGLKISKSLNSKSKTFTYKYLTGKIADNHNLKAYDLNINQIELDTKIKIAKNLLSLRKDKLDYKTIAKVTELSENDVLKLIKIAQFSNFNY